MPSQHTAKIYNREDISLKEFALECTKSFWGGGEELTPAPYYEESLEKYKKELLELDNLDTEELSRKLLDEYSDNIKKKEKGISINIERAMRYDAMLENIKNWNAPSDEHDKLKEFMINQVVESKSFDVSDYYEKLEVKLITPEEYIKERRACLISDINRFTRLSNEENRRVEGCNLWLKQLKDSFN